MSSDQLTYVLVALTVTGVAILLLLAGALLTRRGRAASRAPGAAAATAGADRLRPTAPSQAAPAAMAAGGTPPATTGEALASMPSPSARSGAGPERAGAPGRTAETEPISESGPDLEWEAELEPGTGEPPAAPDETSVTLEDRRAAASRVHDPRDEAFIEDFLSISPRRSREAAFETRPPTASAPLPPAVPPPAPPAGPPAAAAASAPAPAPSTPVVAPPAPELPAPATPAAPPAVPAPADSHVDEVTGLASRLAWERVLAEENARYVRYRRPVGLVVAELDGLARFEAQFGADATRRILVAVGGAMRRTARRPDRVAHVGQGRFLVLLPETDEIQAINYVERVRGEGERWLNAGAVALHLSLGWASPSAVGELDTALRTAEERMYAERRRAARSGTQSPDVSR